MPGHIPLVFNDCLFRWSTHGCNRVGPHTQHLCVCGGWVKNTNPDGAPAKHPRHNDLRRHTK